MTLKSSVPVLDPAINVFLINLDRSLDRLKNATGNLNEVGLPFKRIAAVDGAKLDMGNLGEFANPEALQKNKWITPPAIGCALSHYAAYQAFLASDADWAIILEDDIELSKNIVEVVNVAVSVINKTDVFLLYFHGDEKVFSTDSAKVVNSIYSFHPAASLWGGYAAAAYLIHRDVAKRLRDYVFPVHISADSYGVFHQAGVIGGLWALLPPISKTSNFGSDISYSTLGKLFRRIEATRLPLVSSAFRRVRRILRTTDTKYRVVSERPAWLTAQNGNA